MIFRRDFLVLSLVNETGVNFSYDGYLSFKGGLYHFNEVLARAVSVRQSRDDLYGEGLTFIASCILR